MIYVIKLKSSETCITYILKKTVFIPFQVFQAKWILKWRILEHLEITMILTLIPVKSYKKGLIILVAKTKKDITNHLLKLARLFSQKPMSQFIPVLLSVLEPSRFVWNLPPHKQMTKNLIILQTKQTVKFITCLNCKVFKESAMKFKNV